MEIELCKFNNRSKITEEEIGKMYIEGVAVKEIADKAGISSRSVNYTITKLGIPKRAKGSWRIKYTKNEEFFDEWSNEMAYVLGFLFSDGTISKNQIFLFQKEKEILQEIQNAIKSNAPIYKHETIYKIAVNSKKICESLDRFGIRGNKTYTKKFPDIKEGYEWHFVRGFFDGDGHLNHNGSYLTFSCCSSDFSIPLYNFLLSQGLNAKIKQDIHTIRVVVSGYDSLKKMKELMYESCGELYIKRKFNKFR